MITMPIHQEDIMILNVYVSNKTASKYMKQKMIEQKKGKREIHNYSWKPQHF